MFKPETGDAMLQNDSWIENTVIEGKQILNFQQQRYTWIIKEQSKLE